MRLLRPTSELPEFTRRQYEFAAHIRNPEKNAAPPDVEDRRMGIYRELFYNNVAGFLEANFPVLHEILSDESWHAIVRDFFSRHQCKTPYFPQFPKEFLEYLQTERGERPEDPPFLLELAHYEWVELALSLKDADLDATDPNPDGNLMDGTPVVSSVAWPLAYRFPVHRISPEFQPSTSPDEPTYLLVHRDKEDEIHFKEINAVTFRLLQILAEGTGISGRAALEQVAREMAHPDPEVVIRNGKALLSELNREGIIPGTK